MRHILAPIRDDLASATPFPFRSRHGTGSVEPGRPGCHSMGKRWRRRQWPRGGCALLPPLSGQSSRCNMYMYELGTDISRRPGVGELWSLDRRSQISQPSSGGSQRSRDSPAIQMCRCTRRCGTAELGRGHTFPAVRRYLTTLVFGLHVSQGSWDKAPLRAYGGG